MTTTPRPHDLSAERALLGGLIMDPDRLVEVIQVISPQDFYRDEHGALYRLIRRMATDGDAVDLVTVCERAERGDQSCGELGYIAELIDACPSSMALSAYAKVVLEKAQLRAFIDAMELATVNAYTHKADPGEIVARTLAAIEGIRKTDHSDSWKRAGDIAEDVLASCEEREQARKSGKTVGLTTGMEGLDHSVVGLMETDLIILAGRPSMGKSLLANQMAALHPTIIFSLEMSKAQIIERQIAARARISLDLLRRGWLNESMWHEAIAAKEELDELPLYIDDTAGLTVEDICARARWHYARHGIRLVQVDHAQLVLPTNSRDRRDQQVAHISRALKKLAKDLSIPVMLICQLNRGVESRDNKRPRISDLRESGALEQDGDLILLLYRDEYYNDDTPDRGILECCVAKQRQGRTGVVRLVCNLKYGVISDLVRPARDEPEEALDDYVPEETHLPFAEAK